MKKLALPIALLLVSGLAFAKSKPLADKQLDKISAGSAIADGESTASDSRDFSLDLDDSALKDASAVNITNAVDSTVANATNIWSADHMNDVGREEDGKDEDRRKNEVKQLNVVIQKGVPCDCKPGATISKTETEDEEEFDASIGNAIALDGSKAENKTDMDLELSGSAEENAHAVNITNAVGSLVANATNIASTMNGHNLGSLSQVNVVVQLAH
ncbi:MAG TPA: hypothetical protein VKE93_14355 [Candidatus Angelobacter sp.]|nr:hypothetical protein [Candidatus Angelobacter sp.]